ncbi:ATP-binding cassette domain-containing protein [Mucilaginibacter galii]|uniref:Amino acid ABC transporter ATP-binding protein n=1 Tax=Mucilaginibacter galii TaxID=2005073 RepID=A0A917JDR7_9SPHI|nr:ATP-binding cassette domain-containing protein [Mucilaginibacter galii]GGI52692.1 amino acid ABC transporter ATP-binding protein [Mucilaginibacter galii]
MIIRINNISKAYGTINVLSNISLEISQGRFYTLLGPNGSGKSTLLRCIAKVDSIDTGSIKFNLSDGPKSEVNRHSESLWPDVTIVFQHFVLFPHLNIKQNILLPLKSRYRENYSEIFEKTISDFQFEHLLQKMPWEISVGQRQLVAIARAISLRPRVLLLDEISSALDNLNAKKIALLLKDAVLNGTTIIMVTHSINFAKYCADEYFVITDGSIVEKNLIQQIDNPKSEFLKKSITENKYLI